MEREVARGVKKVSGSKLEVLTSVYSWMHYMYICFEWLITTGSSPTASRLERDVTVSSELHRRDGEGSPLRTKLYHSLAFIFQHVFHITTLLV